MSDEENQDLAFKAIEIGEVVFMRPFETGKYSIVVDELSDFILSGELSYRELRVFLWIEKNTIRFRNTHVRTSRTRISEELKIIKQHLSPTIKSLKAKDCIIEKQIEKNDYYYALNPKKFGGLILLNSIDEVATKINRSFKKNIRTPRKTNVDNSVDNSNLVTDLVTTSNRFGYYKEPNRLPEMLQFIENKDEFGLFNYFLYKYLFLKGVSPRQAEAILIILEQTGKAKLYLPKLIKVIVENKANAVYIVEQILKTDKEKCDGTGCRMDVRSNPIQHIITYWPSMKHNWASCHDRSLQDEESNDLSRWIEECFSFFFKELSKEETGKVFEFKRKA